jgi:hypothetical protein
VCALHLAIQYRAMSPLCAKNERPPQQTSPRVHFAVGNLYPTQAHIGIEQLCLLLCSIRGWPQSRHRCLPPSIIGLDSIQKPPYRFCPPAVVVPTWGTHQPKLALSRPSVASVTVLHAFTIVLLAGFLTVLLTALVFGYALKLVAFCSLLISLHAGVR